MEWKSFRTNWRATLLAKLGNAQVPRLIESTHDSQPARNSVCQHGRNGKMTSDQGHRN